MPSIFKCLHCGKEGISEKETSEMPTNLVVESKGIFHTLQSSVSGGGARLCGPLEQTGSDPIIQ